MREPIEIVLVRVSRHLVVLLIALLLVCGIAFGGTISFVIDFPRAQSGVFVPF